MTEKYASYKGSSLLDALDSSAFPSESSRNQPPAEFSESPLRQYAPKGTQSQSPLSLVSSSGASRSEGGGVVDSARLTQVVNNAAMFHAGEVSMFKIELLM